MIEFDHLPPTSRSLILATLALDIASINCRSIFDLALRRNQTVHDVWREICRRTAQPRCTMPRHVLESQYSAAAFLARPAAPIAAADAGKLAHRAPRSAPMVTRTVLAATSAAPVATAWTGPAYRVHRAGNRQVILTAILAALPLLAIGALIMAATSYSTQTTAVRFEEATRISTAKPDGTVRPGRADPATEAVGTPAPQGTLRRMDAISKAFSKQ